MKIEGMQYPLPVPQKGPRNGNSQSEPGLTEDAVYFEPEEGRKDEQKHSSEEPPRQPLDAQVLTEQVESQSTPTDSAHASEQPKRPHVNIVV